jgi:chemotaxis signal transduction protein
MRDPAVRDAGVEPPPWRVPRAVVFRLGGRVLAAASEPGGRVIEVDSCTRVPTGPAWLLGLANAQGTATSLIDIRPLLGLAVTPWVWPLRAQVAGGDAMRVAVAVEEVLGFEPYRPERLQALAEDAPGGLRAFSRGWLDLASRRAVLLDLPRIVEALRYRSNREEAR